jgi:hypothetical protein
MMETMRGPGYYEAASAFEKTKPKTPSVKIVKEG